MRAIDATTVQRATQNAIQGYLVRCADVLTSSGPDTERMHARLGDTVLGGNTGNVPANLGGPAGAGLTRAEIGAATGVAGRVLPPGLTSSGSIADANDTGNERLTFAANLSQVRAVAATVDAARCASLDETPLFGAAIGNDGLRGRI